MVYFANDLFQPGVGDFWIKIFQCFYLTVLEDFQGKNFFESKYWNICIHLYLMLVQFQNANFVENICKFSVCWFGQPLSITKTLTIPNPRESCFTESLFNMFNSFWFEFSVSNSYIARYNLDDNFMILSFVMFFNYSTPECNSSVFYRKTCWNNDNILIYRNRKWQEITSI